MMEFAEIISYLATALMLVSYCCRTVWLRVFSILGISMNMLFAYMIIDQSLSARSIIFSGFIYLAINIVQLWREIKRKKTRTRRVNVFMPYYIKRKKKTSPAASQGAKRRSKPDLVKKLDRVFSLYIRLRDVMPNGYGRCISCGRIKPFAELDCGHFFSRVHMATRWDEDNCHAECRACNRMSADHIIAYRDNLVQKIGEFRFNRLRVLSASAKHWMPFELEELCSHYKSEVRRLSEEKGVSVKI